MSAPIRQALTVDDLLARVIELQAERDALRRIVGEVAMALSGTSETHLSDPMAQAVAELREAGDVRSGRIVRWSDAVERAWREALTHMGRSDEQPPTV